MLLIKNGTVYTENEILQNTDILVQGKIIKQIGKNLDCENNHVIDAAGKFVLPGFIDPLSRVGCDDGTSRGQRENEELSSIITLNMNSKYAVDDKRVNEQAFYKCGITSAGITLGDLNLLGGEIAAIKTYSIKYSEMFIKEKIGVKGSVAAPVKRAHGHKGIFTTNMKLFQMLRELLNNAESTLNDKSDEPLHRVLRKEIPLCMTAETQNEINMLLECLRDFDLKLVIVGAYEAHKCIGKINEKGASIILGDQMYMPYNVFDTDFVRLNELIKNDSQYIGVSMSSTMPRGPQAFLWNIANLRSIGFSEERILNMTTINSAKILGIDNAVGSLEEGKDADIVVWSNNPLRYYDANVDYAIISGKNIYSREVQ